jgi:hypothetical protein
MTSSGDPFDRYDAAYVLGALTPADRRDFEAHLIGCPSCSAAVAELAGMPGLLGRVPADRVTGPAPDAGAVPDTLLPRLMAASRSDQRRTRRLRLAVAAGLTAAAVAVGAVVVAGDAGSPPTDPPPVAMTAVRSSPVTATYRLEQVAWGTKVHLQCSYVRDVGAYGPRDQTVYRLVAVPRGGGQEQTVAQWGVLPGQDATLAGSTDLPPARIDRLQLETLDGTVLLEAQVASGRDG